MQPQQPFFFGGSVQSPYANPRFQGPSFNYGQRRRIPPPQQQQQQQQVSPNVPGYNIATMNPGTANFLTGGGGGVAGSGAVAAQRRRSLPPSTGVLPALHATPFTAVKRMPPAPPAPPAAGAMGRSIHYPHNQQPQQQHAPIPPNAPAAAPTYMRRPAVPMRRPPIGYPSPFHRTMLMGPSQPTSAAGSPLYTGAGAGAPSSSTSVSADPAAGQQKVRSNGPSNTSFPSLGATAAAAVNGDGAPTASSRAPGVSSFSSSPLAPVPPHQSQSSLTTPATANSLNVELQRFAPSKPRPAEEEEAMSLVMDVEALEEQLAADLMSPVHSQNATGSEGKVNTPPLMASDDDAGPTPTPPSLHTLTPYEEVEVKTFLPEVYFAGTDSCQKIQAVRGTERNDGYDDENFHYRVVVGDHLRYRYEVLKVLGQGTFGIVVRALDHKHHLPVAIKIIKNKPNYTKQAQEEIKTLELLNNDDVNGGANIVRLLESASFRNHYLLVFELLPSDLYAMIHANKFRPMSRAFIYELAEQLLVSLVHVRKHHIVHCDIKPENIMISEGDFFASEPVDFALKLIDFGSACEESRPLFTYIQSRYYRAPEIVLGIPYTTAIDMWSFGCVLCELANGYPIFPASSEGELLERIVEYFGSIPPNLIRQGRRADRFFDGDKMKNNLGKKRPPHPPCSRSLHAFLKVSRTEEDELFEDFIAGCLRLDAHDRLTPEEALEHPWLELWRTYSTGSSGSELSS